MIAASLFGAIAVAHEYGNNTAIVDRAAALLDGDRTAIAATADRFARLGCWYQRDRSRRLADWRRG